MNNQTQRTINPPSNIQNKSVIANLHAAHVAAESLIRDGYTILEVNIIGAPRIIIQWRGLCSQLKPTRLGRVANEDGNGFLMKAMIKNCQINWIEPAHVKELQNRQRTRPVTTKPKSVTRIQHWGM